MALSKKELALRIVRAMRKHSYDVAVGNDVMNIVYVEGMDPDGTANHHIPNHFDDLRCLVRARPDGTSDLLGAWDATTRAGKYFEETAPLNPQGAFHIALGQQRAWVMGKYHDQDALRQEAPLYGTRDTKQDYERAGPVVHGEYGVHHHWGYNYPHDDLGRSSAGCQVGRSKEGHNDFIALLRTDARYKNNHQFMWSSTVMPASWVLEDEKPTIAAPSTAPTAPSAPMTPEPADTVPKPRSRVGLLAALAAGAAWLLSYLQENPLLVGGVVLLILLVGVELLIRLRHKKGGTPS